MSANALLHKPIRPLRPALAQVRPRQDVLIHCQCRCAFLTLRIPNLREGLQVRRAHSFPARGDLTFTRRQAPSEKNLPSAMDRDLNTTTEGASLTSSAALISAQRSNVSKMGDDARAPKPQADASRTTAHGRRRRRGPPNPVLRSQGQDQAIPKAPRADQLRLQKTSKKQANPDPSRPFPSPPRPGAPATVPPSFSSYITQANLPPVVAATRQNLLVILDLNGTLLYRPKASKQPTNFIPRPWAVEFVTCCVESFTTMIWSSAQPRNVQAMVTNLLPANVRSRLAAVWDRDRFGLDPRSYYNKVVCYKRLEVAWSDRVIARAYPHRSNSCGDNGAETGPNRWSQTNTILIDDSPEKATSEPHNHVEVPSFVKDQPELDVLRQVYEYLNNLAYQQDVSRYMRQSPFRVQMEDRRGHDT
ncbi:unnamed protein product [Parascedosporium putredinis]|uniref:Mitochondrial import inner membrane translocase subunit TIM50 n=1 Tax=Parascedosporium putredinis TaxID=1442378 RepID=A0A9P1M6R5_9PEZI|nr:unnamed protein product [Parascedosporium putredinis]CAI7987416.1 unnamed protein product [Parascedosporium putredinis]